MNAQRLARMLSAAWNVARSGTERISKCAHIRIADGVLTITATDGFRLIRQAEPLDAPDAQFAVDLDDVRLQLASLREALGSATPDAASIAATPDAMAEITLRAGADVRQALTPIIAPSDREATAWQRVHTMHAPDDRVQWASITDRALAAKALASLEKNDRCYVHADDGWLNVWRHAEIVESSVTTLERTRYTERAVVLTAPAHEETISARAEVNPQWLQNAAKLFPRAFWLGVTPGAVVVADRRSAPGTMVVIAAMRPRKGDA